MIGLQAGCLLSATALRLRTFQHDCALPRPTAMKGAESRFAAFPEIKRCWRQRVACKGKSPRPDLRFEDDQFGHPTEAILDDAAGALMALAKKADDDFRAPHRSCDRDVRGHERREVACLVSEAGAPDESRDEVSQLLVGQDLDDEVARADRGASLRLDPREELSKGARRTKGERAVSLEMVSGPSVGESVSAERRITTSRKLARRNRRQFRRHASPQRTEPVERGSGHAYSFDPELLHSRIDGGDAARRFKTDVRRSVVADRLHQPNRVAQ